MYEPRSGQDTDVLNKEKIRHALELLDLSTHNDYESKPSPQMIRKAYKVKSLVAHPDKGGTSEAFNELQIAYELLSNENILNSYYTGVDSHGDVLQSDIDLSNINALINQICQKYTTNPLLSDLANYFTEKYLSAWTNERNRQYVDNKMKENSASPNPTEKTNLNTSVSMDADFPDIYLEYDIVDRSLQEVSIPYNYIKLCFHKQDERNGHPITYTMSENLAQEHIVINPSTCPVTDNYLVFMNKGHQYLDSNGNLVRGRVLLDVE